MRMNGMSLSMKGLKTLSNDSHTPLRQYSELVPSELAPTGGYS